MRGDFRMGTRSFFSRLSPKAYDTQEQINVRVKHPGNIRLIRPYLMYCYILAHYMDTSGTNQDNYLPDIAL